MEDEVKSTSVLETKENTAKTDETVKTEDVKAEEVKTEVVTDTKDESKEVKEDEVTKVEETKEEAVKTEVPAKAEDKTVEEIIKEKEKEWQAETDRRVNQALSKKEAEIEQKIHKQLEDRLKAVEIKEVEAEINSVVKAEGIDIKDLKFIKPENYIGDNREKLTEDLESLKALLSTRQSTPTFTPPGVGREYDAYDAARKTGNAEAMLKAKLGKK